MAVAVITSKLVRGTPLKVVAAGNATGLSSVIFDIDTSLYSNPTGSCFIAMGQTGGTGSLTALKVDIQISLDGGNTFNTLQSALNLGSTAAPLAVNTTAIVPGGIYQMNISTFTVASGSPTVDVWMAGNAG